jgi:hypothetical protein
MCKETCSETNTAQAFEFTAAVSELQDFVQATVRSLFHKFNHSTPCATNASLPPSPRDDGKELFIGLLQGYKIIFVS